MTCCFLFYKQKTAYEMRISDWSSDVCSSDLVHDIALDQLERDAPLVAGIAALPGRKLVFTNADAPYARRVLARLGLGESFEALFDLRATNYVPKPHPDAYAGLCAAYDLDPARCLFADDMARNLAPAKAIGMTTVRSEEHTSELQSLMRISYAVFCLKKQKETNR